MKLWPLTPGSTRVFVTVLTGVLAPLSVGTVLLYARRGHEVLDTANQGTSVYVYTLAQVAFLIAGVVIATRLPRNPTGWFFCAVALSGLLGGFAYEYAVAGLLVEPGSLPLAREATLVYQLSATPIGGWFAAIVLTFPTGRLIGPRWRFVVLLVLAGFVSVAVSAIFLWPHRGIELLPTTIDVGGAAQVFWDLPYLFLLPAVVASLVSMIIRFRRARGVERLQLKWFLLGVVLSVVGVFVGPFRDDATGEVLAALGVLCIPIATAIAMLKYRLYDIDLVINRALVYTALTAVLGAAYLGLVVVFQGVLSPLTADSDIAVAGSTLAVAALFRPVRSRVQGFIDRRFYRHKYDATETLEEFSSRLRDRVDLPSLCGDLVAVVGETMQPAHASVVLIGEGSS